MSETMRPRAAPRLVPGALPGGGGIVLVPAGPGVGVPAAPALRPRPMPAALGLEIEGPVPLPGDYRPGTAGFRYWAMAAALERVAALWRVAVDAPWGWMPGGRLRVVLGGGRGAAAFCERGRLVLGGAATPAAAMQALGHAVLDGLCPALWHVAGAQAASFHAGFADAAALLAALEMPGREEGLAQTGQQARTAFGRAFADVLAVLARSGPAARRRPLESPAVALRGARLLALAAQRAAIAPDLMAQVAAEMALGAGVLEGPQVERQLREVFARHGLLARSAALEGYDPHTAEDGTELPLPGHALPWVAVDAAFLGVGRLLRDRPLLVCPASQPPLLAVAADAPAPVAAARAFVEGLAGQGLIETPRIGRQQRKAPRVHPMATHRLVDEGRALRLVRERFACQ